MKTQQFILAVLALGLIKTVRSTSLQPSCTLTDYILNACKSDNKQTGDVQAPCSDLVTECPPNVVFVLDGSDSVTPSGYRLALQSLSREIRTVTQTFANTHVGVVLFSNAVEDLPLQPRTPAEIEDLIRQIQNIPQPRRKTSISKALSRAREMLQEYSVIESRAYNRIKSGSVIVLLTDGQTDNRKETVQEARIAKDSGALIISLSLESPDKLLLKYISHVVQDHVAAVNWTLLVACPARVLDPVQKGRSCRDFVVVVDGSDSVLRHQETVRQFLVYTALRYRLVNNAIGVNVYGTDSQVQASDTRIRPEDNKYDLVDKIRLRLTFPTSGGTGTDRAVAQSVEMLNDDLRQQPSALILITDGPTFDPQATRNAIQNARNNNYPVFVIRVGTALSDEELGLITGGNLIDVFSVSSFTDLFGVDFDGRICDACQSRCPSNARQAGQCGCTCTDPEFEYMASNNSCVRTDRSGCISQCPADAYRGTGCSCVCLDGKIYNEATRTCDCPRTCPSNARQTMQCGCQCVDFSLVYNASTNACDNPCTAQCPSNARRTTSCGCQCVDSNQVYNSFSNQCVLQGCPQGCPSNALRTNNCGCQCVDSNQVYNNISNQCVPQVCTLECPSNARRIGNCGCQCVDSNQVYNSFSNQCVCTQQCPSNAQRINSCGCQCVDSNQVYNSVNNQCVGQVCTLECPSNARRIGNCGCQCTDSNLVYNSFTNQCVCPQQCPSNAQRINSCGCQCVDNNQVYNSVNNQCVGQVCTQECPSNARRISNCGCQCVDSNQVYNSVSNQCVGQVCTVQCPSNARRIDNCGCQCVDSNQVYNSFSNQCVCSQECPSNAQRISNCGCQCVDSNQVYNSVNNQCVGQVCTLQCPSNARRIGNCGCQCVDSNQVYNSFSNQCVCSQECPNNAQRINNCGCQCVDSNQVYNSLNNQCVGQVCSLQCPSTARRIGNCGCQCVDSNQVYNSFSNQCVAQVCPRECPTNAQRISNCGCQCGDGSQVYNNIANLCVCPQECPTNARRINTCGCQCVDSSQVYNSVNNQCVPQDCRQTCPNNAQRIANCGCQCFDNSQFYNSVSNQCVSLPCQQECPNNARRINNCGCQCVDSNQVYNSIINQCESQPCPQECPSNAQRISNCGCQCMDSNQVYNSINNQCVVSVCSRECPSNALRVGNCDCQCLNSTHVYNVNTNQCESVQRQCSRTEFACENNQVAFKDCNDDCFCACSSGFAGIRCEIRLQAELCNDCYYDNGHYHAGVVGYCDLYVSCVPVNQQANSTARPTSFVPYIMSCPPGTFYITRPDGWKGCDYLSNGRCAQDQCESLPTGARYADNAACQSYWQCGSDRRLVSKLCCPAGQRFDWRTSQCLVDSNCPASCARNRTGRCTDDNSGTGSACPFDVNPNDLNEYFYKERPADRLRCQATDIMNLTLCLCDKNPDVRPSPCLPVVNMTFDQPSSNVEVNVPRISIGSEIAANFSGTDDVFLKMFAGSGFWTNYFQINLRLYLPGPVSSGQRIAVVTNADCLTVESVSITMDNANFYFTVYQIGFNLPAVIVIPYAGRADRDGWYSLTLIYRKVGEVFFFSGTVGNYTEMYRGTVPLTTNIDLRTCSLHLGQGYNYAGLVGYVDDFQVWRCDPRQ